MVVTSQRRTHGERRGATRLSTVVARSVISSLAAIANLPSLRLEVATVLVAADML
jgi:hypothetical protein